MLSALTKLPLPLPSLHHVLLGLLVAACGSSAAARELQEDASPRTYATAASMGSDDIDTTPGMLGTDSPSMRPSAVRLMLTAPSVPEPSYPFLGACAGCVALLHRRRRPVPVNFAPARIDLSGLSLERLSSQCSTRAPLARQPVDSHRLIARPTSGRATLRPVKAA